MKIRFLITTLAVSLLATWSFCQEKSAPKSTYAELVAKVKAGDKSVDFKELRFAYADARGGPTQTLRRKQ
jgi:hypothetical protein